MFCFVLKRLTLDSFFFFFFWSQKLINWVSSCLKALDWSPRGKLRKLTRVQYIGVFPICKHPFVWIPVSWQVCFSPPPPKQLCHRNMCNRDGVVYVSTTNRWAGNKGAKQVCQKTSSKEMLSVPRENVQEVECSMFSPKTQVELQSWIDAWCVCSLKQARWYVCC